jgi:cytochrome c biogenesis protein CcmG/thiol:disulfide interchange protein DsbE
MSSVMTTLLVGICAFSCLSPALADPILGQPAPALIASTLDHKEINLADLKGKVVVVTYWATWCAPCHEEMPALEAVYRHYHDKGMEVIAISVDRPRMKGNVLDVMHYFSFPATMLTSLTKNDFGRPAGIPVTYVIGKDGNVAAMLTPDDVPLTEGGLGAMVKELLEAKVEAPKTEAPKVEADAKPAEDKK